MNHWDPIETAPKDGTIVECLWPSYGQPEGRLHQGICVYKKDWYALGKPVELEIWWTGTDFKNPTAKPPTYWRPTDRMENEQLREALISVRAEVDLSKAPKLLAKIEAALGIIQQQGEKREPRS